MKTKLLVTSILAFLSTALFAWEYNDDWYDNGNIVELPTYTVGGSSYDPHWGIPAGAGDLPPTTPPYNPPDVGGGDTGGGNTAAQYETDKRLLSDAAFFSKYGYPKNADLLNSKWFPKQSNANSCVSAASALAVKTVTPTSTVTEGTFLAAWGAVTGDPKVATGERAISADALAIHGGSILNQYANVTSLTGGTSLTDVVANLNSTNVAMVTIQGDYGGVMTHEVVIQKGAGGTLTVYDSALGFSYNTTTDALQPMYNAAQSTAQNTISTLPPMIVSPKP